jgi:asparagine synthase (glutamine-hydrolysing)
MSAVAGIWSRQQQLPGDSLPRQVATMADSMTAGGRESHNAWHDMAAGIAFACRGTQEKCLGVSTCGRFVLASEGEIYNAGALIGELRAAGRALPDGTGMAVMAEGAAQWGVSPMLRRMNGAFAGALWDRQQRELYLFRDRFGMRPLYYASSGRRVLFASRLNGLRACASFVAELDRDALAGYLRWRSLSHPHTIYREARTLKPGTVLRLRAGGEESVETYWALEEAVFAGRENPFAGSAQEAVEELHRLLRKSVAERMGEAPLGVLLSGGVDSTVLFAIAQELNPKSVIGFTVGYREAKYSEAPYAEAAARHLGAEQHTIEVTGEMAAEVLPRLADICDEPNGDISLISACLVSQMARRQVGAAFTGEGAVEPLRAVIPYFKAAELYARIERLPRPLRRIISAGIGAVPATIWSTLGGLLPGRHRLGHLDHRLDKLARILAGDDKDMYRAYRSYWLDPDDVVIGGRELPGLLEDPHTAVVVPDLAQRINYLFTLTTSIDSVTAKADRAAAAAGLQLRMPYLQQDYVDFGWALPLDIRVRDGRHKWVLREVMRRYFPADMVYRRRSGFEIPLALWLRGPLRDWAEDLLSEARLRREGIFDPAPIREKWRQHLRGAHDWAGPLWIVLIFQAWKQRWLP